MGFRISFGIGPLRYSKSLSGKRRSGGSHRSGQARQATAARVAQIREALAKYDGLALDLLRDAMEPPMAPAYRCRHCDKLLTAGQKSHSCPVHPGWRPEGNGWRCLLVITEAQGDNPAGSVYMDFLDQETTIDSFPGPGEFIPPLAMVQVAMHDGGADISETFGAWLNYKSLRDELRKLAG